MASSVATPSPRSGFLHARLAEPWTVSYLAKEVHLPRSQLARAFDASAGASPMSYLRRLRPQGLHLRPVRAQPRHGGDLRRPHRAAGVGHHLQQVLTGLRQHGRLRAFLPRRHRDHSDRRDPAGSFAGPPAWPPAGSVPAGSSSTRMTSSRAITSRETCSSALVRSRASSSIRLQSWSASARATVPCT